MRIINKSIQIKYRLRCYMNIDYTKEDIKIIGNEKLFSGCKMIEILDKNLKNYSLVENYFFHDKDKILEIDVIQLIEL